MRLSSTQIYQQGINVIIEQQSKLTETDLRIASGKKILKPSDDPSASVRILNFNTELGNIGQFSENIDSASTQLAQTEEVLKQSGNVLQRARELLVQANNDSLTGSNRRAIGHELTSLKSELLALANTRDAAGEYIFAGNQVGSQPFTSTGGQTVYNGDQGERSVQVANGIQITVKDSGHEIFGRARSGNGIFEVVADPANQGSGVVRPSQDGAFTPDNYSVEFIQALPTDPVTYEVRDGGGALLTTSTLIAGDSIEFGGVRLEFDGTPEDGDSFSVNPSTTRDLFSTLQDAIDTLNGFADGAVGTSRLHNELNRSLDNLDQSISHVLDQRASVGSRLNSLETQKDVHANNKLHIQQSLSSLQDLDYAEAINEMNIRLTALKAAQQAYIQIQELSLFNYF